MFISMLVNVFDESSAVDSGGAPPEFEGSEKRTEREINNLSKLCNQVPSLSPSRWKILTVEKIKVGWVL